MTTTAIAKDQPAQESARPEAASHADRLLISLLGLSVLGVITQITLGGVVRVTGSGDGCPDWPQCFGSWIPPLQYHPLIEWSHRSTGSLVGVIMFLALVRVIQKYRSRRSLLSFALGGFILVGIVGLIGGQVVLQDLNPAIRTLHLGLAEIVLLLMLSALVVATTPPRWRSFGTGDPPGRYPDGRRVAQIASVAAVAALIALLSGAYAVWHNAGAVCGSWPLCGGSVVPEYTLAWIHMSHRVLAGIGAVAGVYAAYRAFRIRGASLPLKAAASIVIAVVVAQVLIGAANPLTGFDTWARAAHLSMATIMWAATALVAILIWLPINRDRPATTAAARE